MNPLLASTRKDLNTKQASGNAHFCLTRMPSQVLLVSSVHHTVQSCEMTLIYPRRVERGQTKKPFRGAGVVHRAILPSPPSPIHLTITSPLPPYQTQPHSPPTPIHVAPFVAHALESCESCRLVSSSRISFSLLSISGTLASLASNSAFSCSSDMRCPFLRVTSSTLRSSSNCSTY